jgi:hypothetical protein
VIVCITTASRIIVWIPRGLAESTISTSACHTQLSLDVDQPCIKVLGVDSISEVVLGCSKSLVKYHGLCERIVKIE